MKAENKLITFVALAMIGCHPMQPAACEVDFIQSDSELAPVVMEIKSLIRSGVISPEDFEYPLVISGIPRIFSEIPGYTMTINLPDNRIYYCKFNSTAAVPSRQLYSHFMNSELTIKAIMKYH